MNLQHLGADIDGELHDPRQLVEIVLRQREQKTKGHPAFTQFGQACGHAVERLGCTAHAIVRRGFAIQ